MVRRAKSPRARPYSAASLLPPTLSLTDSNSSNPRDQDLRKNAFVEIGHFFIAKKVQNTMKVFQFKRYLLRNGYGVVKSAKLIY